MFLSTPPSRVATATAAIAPLITKVSIHATLAGGDGIALYRDFRAERVSIHATLAGGDLRSRSARLAFRVSIHATLAGGDPPAFPCTVRGHVSIHATLAGGDTAPHSSLRLVILFLSTPPSRVATPTCRRLSKPPACFYPRHPRGWRLRLERRCVQQGNVSIHATLAGGDR